MGMLEQDGRHLTLSARFEVGRNPDCALHIPDRRVSGQHARLVWTREGWQIRDLGSTNGTTLNGQRIDAGRDHRLEEGAALAFGDASFRWVLIDTAPPQALAIAASGTRRFAEGGLLALPDDDEPAAVIFEMEPGAWLVEIDGVPRPVVDQERLSVRDQVWRLSLPTTYDQTWAAAAQDTPRLGLRFEVSRDEEYTRLSLLNREQPTEIPARTHHYMLLLLARARLTDRGEGLTTGEAGWLYSQQLCQMLRADQYQLNVLVHRARRQFSRLDEVSAGQLIERRRLTQQLRIGIDHLTIEPLL